MADKDLTKNLTLEGRLGGKGKGRRKAERKGEKGAEREPRPIKPESKLTRAALRATRGEKAQRELDKLARELDRRTQNYLGRLMPTRNNMPEYAARGDALFGVEPRKADTAAAALVSAAKGGAGIGGWGRRAMGRAMGGGGAAGGPAPLSLEQELGLPPIVESDYVRPFDEAAAGAQAAYKAAVPAIDQQYADLIAQLKGGAADMTGALARQRAAMVAQMAASKGEMDGFAAQQLASPHVTDPMLRSAAEDEVVARQAAQAQSADARLALADRFAEIQRQGSDARISDAGLAKAAAQSNAAVNLQQMLGRIGVERSGAQAQFRKDTEDRKLTLAEEQRKRAEDERKSTESFLAELEQAKMTPAQRWKKLEPKVAGTYQRGYAAYREILDGDAEAGVKPVKGKGVRAMNEAIARLEQLAPALQADGLNVGKIRQWIEMTYNDWDEDVPEELAASIAARYGRG